MDVSTTQRQRLVESINTLPDEVLLELTDFVEYLRYKSIRQQTEKKPGSPFLLSVAAIGTSAETDISERDEEILAREVDSVYGWSLRSENGS